MFKLRFTSVVIGSKSQSVVAVVIDQFYIALFSAPEQSRRCTLVACESECRRDRSFFSMVFFLISTEAVLASVDSDPYICEAAKEAAGLPAICSSMLTAILSGVVGVSKLYMRVSSSATLTLIFTHM